MSGHSKWATIKRKKGALDQARGKAFAKLARQLEVAAREGGGDPSANSALRTVVLKAKAAQMTNDAIDRAIKRGTGVQTGAAYEAITYEGYGPGGVAVLIEALTDNRNRAAAEIRLAFSKNGGNLGETGCVGYLFEHRSVVRIAQPGLQEDALLEQLLALEERGGAAVLSYELDAEGAEVFGPFEQLEALQDGLRALGLPVGGWEHRWVANTPCRLEDAAAVGHCLKLLDALEELDDVRSVTANLDADEALLEAALS